jgi:hypothetical protein
MIAFLSVAVLSLLLTAIYVVPLEIADRRSRCSSGWCRTWVWLGWTLPLILLWLSSAFVAAKELMNPETLVVLAQLAGCVYLLLIVFLLIARGIRRRHAKNA